MTDINTADLRAGATNIHSIGPDRAAGLLTAAADAIDKLRHDLAEARRIAGRHSTELGHLRKLHVPGGFRSALTDKGEPAAFIPTGPIEPGSAPGFYRLASVNAPALLQASVNALRDRWAAETERRLRDLEVGQRLASCLPSLDWPADWRVLQPGENPPLGREWTIWGPMTPEARALADAEASIPEARRLFGIADDPTINVVGEERGCPEGTCLAMPPCRNRAEMRANHGTPDEFELAIMRAAPELSVAEADRAVTGYRAAWEAASGPDTSPQPSSEQVPRFDGLVRTCMLSWPDTKCSGTHDQPVPDLSTPIGAPSLAIAEQFDAEARAASEDPGELGDIESVDLDIPPMPVQLAEHRRRAAVDLWPGSGLPPLLSTTRGRIEQWKKRQSTTPGAETYDFTPEQEAEAAEQAERFQGLDDSDRE